MSRASALPMCVSVYARFRLFFLSKWCVLFFRVSDELLARMQKYKMIASRAFTRPRLYKKDHARTRWDKKQRLWNWAITHARPKIQIAGAIVELRKNQGRPCFALWVSKQFWLGRGSCSCKRADQALTKDEWRPRFIERWSADELAPPTVTMSTIANRWVQQRCHDATWATDANDRNTNHRCDFEWFMFLNIAQWVAMSLTGVKISE